MKNIQIAQMLNISPATVSLALNNKPGVSEETKRRVLELRDSLLQDDLVGRSRVRNIGTVGLLVYKGRNEIIAETPFFVQLIDTVSSCAEEMGYRLSIIYSVAEDVADLIEEIEPLALSGLIIIATEMSSDDVCFFQENMSTPFVMVDAFFPDCNVDTVVMNNAAGIIRSVRYAYSRGHREIGFLSTEKRCNNFIHRLEAYFSEIGRLGIPRDDAFIYTLPLGVDKAMERMRGYLVPDVRLPTVFVADNDRVAIGAIKALQEAGYDVPGDVSVIGFDNMPMTQYVTPALTSVAVHQSDIAKRAVERLVKKITDPQERLYTVQQFVEVTFIERASVKKR